jgi:hypothetical protein
VHHHECDVRLTSLSSEFHHLASLHLRIDKTSRVQLAFLSGEFTNFGLDIVVWLTSCLLDKFVTLPETTPQISLSTLPDGFAKTAIPTVTLPLINDAIGISVRFYKLWTRMTADSHSGSGKIYVAMTGGIRRLQSNLSPTISPHPPPPLSRLIPLLVHHTP